MAVFKRYDGTIIDDFEHTHVPEDTQALRDVPSAGTTEYIDKNGITIDYYSTLLTPTVTEKTVGSRIIYSLSTTNSTDLDGNLVLKVNLTQPLYSYNTYFMMIEPIEDVNTKTNIINIGYGINKPFDFKTGLCIVEPIRRPVENLGDKILYTYKIRPQTTIKSLIIYLYTSTKVTSGTKNLLNFTIKNLDYINKSTTAIATVDETGFMSVEDKFKLDDIDTSAKYIEDKLGTALFYRKPRTVELQDGSDFRSKLVNSGFKNYTSVVFTKTAIPSDKISSAIIISTRYSEAKAYMYLDGDTVYVSPEEDNAIIYANKNCRRMFYSCNNLTSIDFTNFNTSNVTDMSEMFRDCNLSASIIGLENWDTSNVTRMHYMFGGCNLTTSLDLSNWDTSKVTDMSKMFYFNDNLISIVGLENWNTSNVTDMSSMFSICMSLTSLNVSNFNTSNVTDMSEMFRRCEQLTSLNVSNFNTSKVNNMYYMFGECNSLTSLDLSNWDTSKVTDMRLMFLYCYNLSGEITIMNPNITTYSSMFYDCSTDANTKFIVKYVDGCKDIAQILVNTKSSNSNVFLYEKYNITFKRK